MMSRREWSLSDDQGFRNLDDHREAMPDLSFRPGVSHIRPRQKHPHRTLPEPRPENMPQLVRAFFGDPELRYITA